MLANAEICAACAITATLSETRSDRGEPVRSWAAQSRPAHPLDPPERRSVYSVEPMDFDPFAPRCFDDPYPAYLWLRREAPVYRRADPAYFLLSRYDDIANAMTNASSFSSARGVLIDTDSEKLPVNLMNMDPPRHDELRAMLTRALTESRIAKLEERFREITVELIESFRSRGECDLVGDFARVLPSRVIAEVLEVDPADRDDFLRWNHAVNAGSEFTGDEALAAYQELDAYFREVIADRRRHPRDDLVSRVFLERQAGEEINDDEVKGFCTLLLVAGQHATINWISNSIIELSRHRDQLELLIERPELLRRGAAEELLRYVSPVQGLARTTTRDLVLHGVEIPRDSQVLLLFGSANRDERRFPGADRLDVTKPPEKSHFAFGHGIHYCAGSAVARLEGRVALEELIRCFGHFEVDEASIERNQLVPGRGVGRVDVRFAKS